MTFVYWMESGTLLRLPAALRNEHVFNACDPNVNSNLMSCGYKQIEHRMEGKNLCQYLLLNRHKGSKLQIDW